MPSYGRRHPPNTGQLGLLVPESAWRAPAKLPRLRGRKVIALDLETRDPRIKDHGPGWAQGVGEVVGIGVGFTEDEDGPRGPRVSGFYLPFAHGPGGRAEGNLDPGQVERWVRSELDGFDGTIVGANVLYDVGWTRRQWGVNLASTAKFYDISWLEALLTDVAPSYSLDSCLKRYGLPGKDEHLLQEAAAAMGVDPKSGLWQLEPKYVGPYNERDCTGPLDLYQLQLLEVAKHDRLERCVELEHSLIPCLLDMRWRGVRVDLEYAERFKTELMLKEQAELDKIRRLTGLEVAVWENDSVAKAFLDQSVNFPRTASGKPSFRKEWLEEHPSELARAVTAARQYNKGWRDFIQKFIIESSYNGRLHGEFHPLRHDRDEDNPRSKLGGAITGRFSGSHPNLQFIPARHPLIGPGTRKCYLGEEGCDWYALDYSQQEPRLTIHYAVLLGLPGAAEAAEEFRRNPRTDYHQFVADLTTLPRKQAKTINLGLPYTMGGAKFCRQVGLPTKTVERRDGSTYKAAGDEGQALLDKYDARLPYARKIMAHCRDVAVERGFIVTMSGRYARFDLWEPTHRWGPPLPYEQAEKQYGASRLRRAFTKDALNRLIQGGSADMIKYSLVALHRAGLTPHITIHDENGFGGLTSPKQAAEARDIMVECVKLKLPLVVDLDRGRSWGEAKPFSAAIAEEMRE